MAASGATFVAGHRGMVGAAIARTLQSRGEQIIVRDRARLDLASQSDVRAFFEETKPARVVIAAAKVGGIHANNTFPADFIYDNLMIEANLIHEAWRHRVERLLFLGSTCIYPRMAPQPISEKAMLGGYLEATNEPYAIAKIAGIKLCESYNRQHGTDFRTVIPTNLYGPGDNYHPENSHVIPALLRRFHEAKESGAAEVTIWGTGTPRRDFLHVDDMAAASVHVLDLPKNVYDANTEPMVSHINVGSGEDLPISELATLIAEVVGYRGAIHYDASKPDGTPRKLTDVSRLKALGWAPKIALAEGLRATYRDFSANEADARSR
jgi:GDP-L-fucose synthase